MDITVEFFNTPPYFTTLLKTFYRIRFNTSEEYIYLPTIVDDENNNFWLNAIVNPSLN